MKQKIPQHTIHTHKSREALLSPTEVLSTNSANSMLYLYAQRKDNLYMKTIETKNEISTMVFTTANHFTVGQ